MATNTGKGSRKGPMKDRFQQHIGGEWVKFDGTTGKKMGAKETRWAGVSVGKPGRPAK